MDALQNYLIELCRAYLENRQVSLSDDVDYHALYALAKVHNLSAIVFCVLNTAPNSHIVPQDALKRFDGDFLEAVVRYDFQSAQISEISALCRESNIRHIFFKGTELRDLFPVPEARVMGDADVLIAPEDRTRMKALLEENGYSCKNANGNVYEYTRDGLLTEVHTKIISGKIGDTDLEAYFADAMAHAAFDGTQGKLEDNYHFAYLLAHTAHHFWFYGAGLKLLLDLAVMLAKCQIDLNRVLTLLAPCRLERFAKVLLTLTHQWFGCGRDYGVSTESTAAFLLSYGAFGNSNRDKAAVIARKDMEQGGRGSGFSAKWHLLFPPYQTIRNIPYIRFIDGRPYLLPAAWIYRIYYNFRYRKAFVQSATKNLGSDETKESAKEELAFFEEIGLL